MAKKKGPKYRPDLMDAYLEAQGGAGSKPKPPKNNGADEMAAHIVEQQAIMDATNAGAAASDPFNGWDAGSLMDASATSGGGGGGGGGGRGRGRRGGGGGGGGGGGPAIDTSALIGQLAGADAMTAAMRQYLEQLRATEALRKQPFDAAQAELAALYNSGRSTIAGADAALRDQLVRQQAAGQSAFNDYRTNSAQLQQQAVGTGQAELAALLRDLRAQGASTTDLEAQQAYQANLLGQYGARGDQLGADLERSMIEAFRSRDAGRGLVNAAATGQIEANNMAGNTQLQAALAQAMIQYQQELAQAQLQVAQQEAQAAAIRAQLEQLGVAAPAGAAPTAAPAAAPAPAPEPAAPAAPPAGTGTQTSAPVPPTPDGVRTPSPTADQVRSEVQRVGGRPLANPELVQTYLQQLQSGGPNPQRFQRDSNGRLVNGKRPIAITLPRSAR